MITKHKYSNTLLLGQATDITSNVDHVLGHESIETLDSRSLYDLASRLEDARNILLTLGDRVGREEREANPAEYANGVPF
jgi:hypothetical protein